MSGRVPVLLLLCLLVAQGGCVWQTRPPPEPRIGGDTARQACEALFQRLDQEVRSARSADAAAARIDGFPWLRVTRPLASFAGELDSGPGFQAWLLQLSLADAQARGHELVNLPYQQRVALQRAWRSSADKQQLAASLPLALEQCRELFNHELLQDEQAMARLRASATVPDAYRDWQRVLGLYPFAALIARPRVEALHARLASRPLPDSAALRLYAAAPGLPPEVPRLLVRDALGIPDPAAVQARQLLHEHAPVWAIEQQGPADIPGALLLDAHDQPFAAGWHPVEYRRISWTRFGGEVLLQLNYSLWFSERPASGLLDIYAGHLDSVTWRVTLNTDGSVLAYDSIHGCGCYYMLWPAEDWRVRTPQPTEEPVYSPGIAPQPAAAERVQLTLEGGTHYLLAAQLVGAGQAARELFVLPEDNLRSLPRPAGGRRSAFGSDGMISASRRAERFVLWPLGVPSAGASRQHGQHAIAFIGRRHFDDPYLLENLLEPVQ